MTYYTFNIVYFYQRTKQCVKASIRPAACCYTVCGCGQVESVNGSSPKTASVILPKMNNAVKIAHLSICHFQKYKFVVNFITRKRVNITINGTLMAKTQIIYHCFLM